MFSRSTSLSIIRSSHLPPSEVIFFFRSLVGQRLTKHRRLIVCRLSHRLPYDGQFIQYHPSIHLPNELVRTEGSQTASLAHLLAAHHRAVPQTKGKFKRFSKKRKQVSPVVTCSPRLLSTHITRLKISASTSRPSISVLISDSRLHPDQSEL